MPKIMRPLYKSSRSEAFYKNSVLKNIAKLTRKHLCWSLLFNEVAGLQSRKKPL